MVRRVNNDGKSDARRHLIATLGAIVGVKAAAEARNLMARIEAAETAAEAAKITAARDAHAAYVESERPRKETLDRLNQMLARIASVDVSFWPIHERVLRSRAHIHQFIDGLLADREHFDVLRFELINALWWEIRAIEFLRKDQGGRPPGKLGETQESIRELLHEKPDADLRAIERHLKARLPKRKPLKRESIKNAATAARRAMGIK